MATDPIAFANRQMNILCKWRSVFAGWQLGTRPNTDPECQAVRDHREVTLLLRAECSAIAGILIENGLVTAEEFTVRVGREAELLSLALEDRFPGFKATEFGITMQADKAAQTMKGWRP